MQEEVSRECLLRCLCGHRMQASYDGALLGMLRDHIQREHTYAEAPSEERVKEMISSAVYSFEYVPLGDHYSLEEEGFGPEPYWLAEPPHSTGPNELGPPKGKTDSERYYAQYSAPDYLSPDAHAYRTGAKRDPANELWRTVLPRNRVNKGKREG